MYVCNTRAAAKIRGVGERASGSVFYSVSMHLFLGNLLARGSRHFFHTAQVSCVILFIIFNVHPRGGTPGKL